MNTLLSKINIFIASLSTKTMAALEDISVEKKFKKGDFLLLQNDICRKSYTIENGIARKYYLSEGKEITTELYFETDIAVSFESYSLQKPSKEFIQAISDITVSQIDYLAFQNAKNSFPDLETLDLLMTEYYAMWLEDRLFQFHTLDATARYQKLLKEHPHVVQSIPLTFIASYLGVSLETLSRIRAKRI
jgi:CRP-like cAMP-binding protein